MFSFMYIEWSKNNQMSINRYSKEKHVFIYTTLNNNSFFIFLFSEKKNVLILSLSLFSS